MVDPNAGNTTSGNIQALVSRVDYGISMVRMMDITQGIFNFNFFGSGTMMSNTIGFEITDSLDAFYKIGKVVLADEDAFNELMPLTGNEVIAIRYKNMVSSINSGEKIVYFRIFSVDETDNFMNQNAKPSSKFIVLNLAEFPAFDMLSLSAVYKSYPDNKNYVSTIAQDMLKAIPNIEKYYAIQNVDKTQGTLSFWIPHWTPMKTLKYLQQYAMSDDNLPMYVLRIEQSDMKTSSSASQLQSMSFTSVYSLLQSASGRVYSTIKAEQRYRDPDVANDPTAIDPSPSADQDKNNTPQDVILAKRIISADGSMTYAGMNGFTLVSRDAVDGCITYPSTYRDFMSDYNSLGFYGVYPTDPNKVWGNQWSKYSPTHLPSKNADIINAYQSNIYARRTLLGAEKAVLFCYVNEFRKPGELATLMLPSGNPANMLDFMRSGNYLTWSVTDKVMASGEGVSEVMVVRDSYHLPDGVSGFLPKLSSSLTNANISSLNPLS